MIKARLLIVDDDASGRRWLGKLLMKEGYEVDVAEDGPQALGLLMTRAPALIITDLNMPRMNGLELLQRVREANSAVGMIMVTAQDRVASAVAAMRAGALDYLTKPLDFDALRLSVERTLAHLALVSEAEDLRRRLRARDGEGLADLVGTSPPMQRVYRVARQIASAHASVWIRGEAGTGRRALAATIHELSSRPGPFVAVDCSSLTEEVMVERARHAANGTLFLSEACELSPQAQLALLDLFEKGDVSARVIAASRKEPALEVEQGRLREQLLYKLSVVTIDMPPLRLRGSDVVALAERLVHKFAQENRRLVDGLSDAARRKVAAYHWPGNLPELENVLHSAVLLTEGVFVEPEALPFQPVAESFETLRIPGATMAEVERYVITKTFEAAEQSSARAAEILDISVRTIQYRLAEYGIPTKRAKTSESER
jgi:two-component system, NtrC family, response regulator HydG